MGDMGSGEVWARLKFITGYFQISDGSPTGAKRNLHLNPILCRSGAEVQPTSIKLHMRLHPHPSGQKPTDDSKPKPELSSLSPPPLHSRATATLSEPTQVVRSKTDYLGSDLTKPVWCRSRLVYEPQPTTL
jgi:hypothetical protein